MNIINHNLIKYLIVLSLTSSIYMLYNIYLLLFILISIT